MTTVHLRVSAGGYALLLDSALVRRVTATDAAESDGEAGASRDLPRLDLSLLLGGAMAAPSAPVRIVYAAGGDDDAAVALTVDAVIGLVTLGPQALARLPPISERFAQLFDAIAIEPIDGLHPLRLRPRLDSRAISLEDARHD